MNTQHDTQTPETPSERAQRVADQHFEQRRAALARAEREEIASIERRTDAECLSLLLASAEAEGRRRVRSADRRAIRRAALSGL